MACVFGDRTRMFFNDLPMLSMMTKKLTWLSQRTEVLAQNVANADTPGFKARDVKGVDFRKLVAKERGTMAITNVPTVTHAGHLKGTIAAQSSDFRVERSPDMNGVSFDGNTVSAEQQLMKLGETQASHQMTLNLYRKHLSMLRIAIGRGA
ncbi:MAG: flagellar basal body rod protein FlgB [Alphaproteobacteria bacterium]